MSRGVLKQCPACKGADTDLRPCRTCKGVRMVPDSPAGEPDVCEHHWHCDPMTAAHLCCVDRTKPCPSCGATSAVSREHALSTARIALREAALNYAAARLMSAASAEHVNRAFAVLEEAADEHTRVMDHYKEGK